MLAAAAAAAATEIIYMLFNYFFSAPSIPHSELFIVGKDALADYQIRMRYLIAIVTFCRY